MTTLDLGGVVGRVALDDTAFQRVWTKVMGQMRQFGAEATKAAGGTAQLDEAMAATGKSGSSAAAGLDRATAASTRSTAAQQRAALQAKALADAQARLTDLTASMASASTREQQALLRQAAAQERASLAAGQGSAQYARLASAQASVVAANRAVIKSQGDAGASMIAAGKKANKYLTLPLVAAAAVSVDQAAKFQKSMNTISVATDQSAASTAEGSKGLQRIAIETGQSLSQLSDALYTATKSGMPMAQALQVVEASAKGAAAEGADLGVATQALTSIMASYGKSLGSPVQAENALIRGAGLAKTTYQDFADSLANVVPVASSLHISFAQVAGAIDTMTQHGETAQRATDNLSNLITNLAGQNNVASASLQQLGVNTIDLSKNLGKRGLTGSLDLVLAAIDKHGKDGMIVTSAFKQAAIATQSLQTEIDKLPKSMQANAKAFVAGTMSYKDFYAYTKSLGGEQFAMAKNLITTQHAAQGFNAQLVSGNSTVSTLARTLQKSLGGVTGMRTALMLSGNSAQTFKDDVNAVSKAAKESGADILGWAQTQNTLTNKMDRAKESMQVLAVEVGDELLPAFSKLATEGTHAVQWVSGLSHTQKEVLGWSVGVVAAVGPVLSIGGRLATVGSMIGNFTSTTAAKLATLAGASEASSLRIATSMRMTTAALAGAGIGLALGEITKDSSNTTKALGALGSAATGAAVGFGAGGGVLGAAVGGTVGLLTDAASAFHLFGGSVKQQIKPTQDFTQAILQDNDALGENTRKLVENSLESKGAYDAALKLGISQKTLTDAMMGVPSALAKVQAAQLGVTASIGYGITAASHLTKAQQAQIDANAKLSSVIGDVTETLKVNQQAANNIAAADGKQKNATDAVASSTKGVAKATRDAASSGNAYLDVLAKLVKEHKIKVDTSQAQVQVRTLQNDLSHLYSSILNPPSAPKGGGLLIGASDGKKHATGGTITQGTTGTADDVLIRASKGEEIIRASQAAKHRPLLKAINAGVDGFAAGGTVGHISLGHAAHWTAGNVGQILRSGQFGSELISGLSQTMHAILAAVSSAAGLAGTASAQVQATVAAGLRPSPSTVGGWEKQLGRDTTSADKVQTVASTARANYLQLAKLADAQDKAAKEAQNQAAAAKKAATALSGSTAAEKAAKKAAEDHANTLANAAKKAKTLAAAASNLASKGKSAWQAYQQAADTATQKMVTDIQGLESTLSGQISSMLQEVQGFESGIQSGLTSGGDLATIYGQLTSNVDSAKQALDAAQQALQQATPDTTALAAAQAAQAAAAQEQAAAHAQLTQALAGGNAAAILAAQKEQTDASSKLAAAQAAVQAATPTADQLAAQAQAQQQLTDAQNAYNQAVQASSASGVASVLAQFQASEQQFADDLDKLRGEGAGQDLISQIAGLGDQAGDALAKGLINDPAALASISKSMGAIQKIADTESSTLAQGFLGAGVQSMVQLLAGIEKQFPETKAALAPLAAQLAAMFQITLPDGSTVGGTVGSGGSSAGSSSSGPSGSKDTTASQTPNYYLVHALENDQWYDVNPSKKSVHLLTAAQLKADLAAGATVKTRASGIPHFAMGTADFAAGGPAWVAEHGPELIDLPRHARVTPLGSVSKGSTPFGDTSGIERRLDALNARISTLADDIGEVQARVGAGLYRQAGDAQAQRLARIGRKS